MVPILDLPKIKKSMLPQYSPLCETDTGAYLAYLESVNGSNLLEHGCVLAVDSRCSSVRHYLRLHGGLLLSEEQATSAIGLLDGDSVGGARCLGVSAGVSVAGGGPAVEDDVAGACVSGLKDGVVERQGFPGGRCGGGPDGGFGGGSFPCERVSGKDCRSGSGLCGGDGCGVCSLDANTSGASGASLVVGDSRVSAASVAGAALSDVDRVGVIAATSCIQGVSVGKWHAKNVRKRRNRRSRIAESHLDVKVPVDTGLKSHAFTEKLSYFAGLSDEVRLSLATSRAEMLVKKNELEKERACEGLERMRVERESGVRAARSLCGKLSLEEKLARLSRRRLGESAGSSFVRGSAETIASGSSSAVPGLTPGTMSPNSSISVAEERRLRARVAELEAALKERRGKLEAEVERLKEEVDHLTQGFHMPEMHFEDFGQ